jgi:predicted phosphohydrolase
MTRFVFVSDTHTKHAQMTIPDGDVLVHTGDFCIAGDTREAVDFMRWFESQPHEHKIFIAGNHDRCFELQSEIVRKLITDIMPTSTYLEDSGTFVAGFRIWGSPWTPLFMTDWWRFHKRRGEGMASVWRKIPTDVDILLTHGPAFGTLDQNGRGDRAGDEELQKRIDELSHLKLHAFGHIHDSYGMKDRATPIREAFSLPPYIAVNAAMLDDTYSNQREPITVDL